ncbi:hypothetical protein [Alteromonas sp. RKMC-009]|uniref:hypothetical protein n=1 Tax=Alteromonas sp. RKMC-009 TaxID=2267264 RepID=UPI000E692799|nr:hypothetical protein [Alteromonas sp. RKMC-009]AYA64517.1 hypothetical protein DS731_11135 [Alteromonas sp. RKMC-009]
MSSEIKEKHAKLLAEVITQSSHWKLQPEKKSPFHSAEEAFKYIESHNEPLYVVVPVNGDDNDVLVKVSSEEDDVVFETVSNEDKKQAKVHHSHLKLIESTVTELVNSQLEEGKKAASM